MALYLGLEDLKSELSGYEQFIKFLPGVSGPLLPATVAPSEFLAQVPNTGKSRFRGSYLSAQVLSTNLILGRSGGEPSCSDPCFAPRMAHH